MDQTFITLFKPIAVSCGTDNILWNIPRSCWMGESSVEYCQSHRTLLSWVWIMLCLDLSNRAHKIKSANYIISLSTGCDKILECGLRELTHTSSQLAWSASHKWQCHIGHSDEKTILVVDVDNSFVTGEDEQEIKWLKQQLRQKLDLTDLGPITKHLGVEFKNTIPKTLNPKPPNPTSTCYGHA